MLEMNNLLQVNFTLGVGVELTLLYSAPHKYLGNNKNAHGKT